MARTLFDPSHHRVFAGMALLPFAVSLGLGFYIVFDHVFGMTAALVAGSAFCLLAGAFWYGLGFSPPPEEPEEDHARGKANAADDEDRANAHRGRVILPGAQALLGFQLTVTLTRRSGSFPTR
jgi:hypothetical protein